MDDEAYSKLTILTEAMVELYSHLRALVPKRLANEMNISLEVLNKETDFFGDMDCDSRWEDMLLDGEDQYQDHSDLKECPMWEIFTNETFSH